MAAIRYINVVEGEIWAWRHLWARDRNVGVKAKPDFSLCLWWGRPVGSGGQTEANGLRLWCKARRLT